MSGVVLHVRRCNTSLALHNDAPHRARFAVTSLVAVWALTERNRPQRPHFGRRLAARLGEHFASSHSSSAPTG